MILKRPIRPLLLAGGIAVALTIIVPLVVGGIFYINRQNIHQKAMANIGFIENAATTVTISAPAEGSIFPINTSIPVHVEVKSDLPVTELDLFVNGDEVVFTVDSTKDPEVFNLSWDYVPASEGDQTLFIRADNSSGQTVFSNAIHINITPPVKTFIQVEAQEGDTLASMAAPYGVEPEDVRPAIWNDVNQSWENNDLPELASGSNSAVLQAGQPVTIELVKHLDPSKVNVHDANPLPENLMVERKVTFLDPVFEFLGEVTRDYETGKPAAPWISAGVDEMYCGVNIYIFDPTENSQSSGPDKTDELGFNLYRVSKTDSHLIKVATFPPQTEYSGTGINYHDVHQTGTPVYVASAFNEAGETFSDPLPYPMYNNYCGTTVGENGLVIQNDKIIFPSNLDRVYMYVARAGFTRERVPLNPNEFLPNDGDSPYIFDLIESLPIGSNTEPGDPFIVTKIDVWGWQGDELIHVGNINTSLAPVYPTQLSVCIHTGFCNEGIGLVDTLVVTEAEANQSGKFWSFVWDTQNMSGKRAVWQISSTSFVDNASMLRNVITGQSPQKEFTIDPLDYHNNPNKPPSEPVDGIESLNALEKPYLPLKDGDIYFVRVIPMIGDHIAGRPSNQVKIEIRDSNQ